MADTSERPSARFDINPAVVFRLGEELITDEVQALVELVKNSYDADATWVKVVIDTKSENPKSKSYPGARGQIRIEDDGDGMTLPIIKRGWLTIASSPKKAQKEHGEVTRLGRTAIGDKGLGRLGVQRLAENIEIFTKPREETVEHYVAFSWKDFRNTASLSEVPVKLESKNRKSPEKGTTLFLSDLRNLDGWLGEPNIRNLQRELSGMLSPYREVANFFVYLEVDGKKLELAEIADKVRESAQLRYKFEFDGTTFRISGKVRLGFLQPGQKEDQGFFDSICREDGGKTLFEFLSKKAKRRRPPVFERSGSTGWFIEFGTEYKLEDLDKVRVLEQKEEDDKKKKVVANPGPFHGEVDAVSLDRSDFPKNIMDRLSDYRRLVGDLSGIRVYRDGFGIRVDEDWLGLGKQWTSARSYYTLKPRNVLGYVALSARENQALTETTSRERFQVTPHYENFYALMTEFISFTGSSQEFLRRGTSDFLNQKREEQAGLNPSGDAVDITRKIDDVASSLGAEREKLDGQTAKLRQVADGATSTLEKVRKEIKHQTYENPGVKAAFRKLDQALTDLTVASSDAEVLLRQVSTTLERASELKGIREILDRRWETLQEELDSFYETVSLGLTAEVLSHEIHNIADGLARRSKDVLDQLRTGEIRTATMVGFVEHVRSAIAGMRKQLAHLTPSLRYLREQRERIGITHFLEELCAFYHDRLKGKGITIGVQEKTGPSIFLNINKGKLSQVFDNLVLNAEYWLCEAIRRGDIKAGKISIFVENTFVRFMDNGRGVDPTVEINLFDPFVTMKRKGEGRGLGLFVVQQLLDAESCKIILLQERNGLQRRYIFEIDFTGAFCD